MKTKFTCSSCGKVHTQWFGKCNCCGSWNTIVESEVTPKKYSIPKVSEKKKLKDSLPSGAELENWFEMQKKKALLNPFCENCGTNILHQLESEEQWVWKSSHAHIFPKKTFKSIMTHEDNHLLLCRLCHGQFDSSWTNASKMKVWEIAKVRAQKLLPSITESITKIGESGIFD